MIRWIHIFIIFAVCLTLNAKSSSAYEVVVSCDSVQAIHVGKGRCHLADGKFEILYGATVLVDPTSCNLKDVYADCHDDSITIRINGKVFVIPKTSTTPAGDWFGVDRPTPRETVNTAMGMCPDKVIVHFTESELRGDTQQP